jgi:hypothetical protein
MVITLLPHQEKAIEAAIRAGVIHSVEEWIDRAIAELPSGADRGDSAPAAKNLVELLAPVRGLFADGELDFSRDRSPDRPLDLG